MPDATPEPHSMQAEYWGGEGGVNWVADEAFHDATLAPIAATILERLDPQPGERILDVGAGTGTLALAVAARVRPGGHVTALDVSEPMLRRTAERIAEEGLDDTVDVLLADAQRQPPPVDSFDAVTSRFGVMFFDDPILAFANLAAATRAGGRLAVAVWQPAERSEMFTIPGGVVARHVTVPQPMPGQPGPFSMSDPDVVRRILGEAGWVDIDIADETGTHLLGGPGTIDAAVDFALRRTTVAAALRDTDDATRAAIRSELAAALADHVDPRTNAGGTGVNTPGTATGGTSDGGTGDGGVRLTYAIWLVTARRPA